MKKIMAISLAMLMGLNVIGCANQTANNEQPETKPETNTEQEQTSDDKAPEQPADSSSSEDAPAETSDGGIAGKRIAIVVKSTGNPYNERQIAGFEEAANELGAQVIVKAPDSPTVEAQLAMVDELIIQKVDGIAIAGNDPDALQNTLQKAMDAGIPVVSFDSAVNAASRIAHINQADTKKIGETLVEAAFDMSGGSGKFAILSATSQAANQNMWIEAMQETLKDPKYASLELVKIAYGDDLRDKSTTETEGLLKSYPDLKVIVAPTTVGIAATAKVIQDKGLSDQIKVTGLGLPSEMAEYIENGTTPYMYLWNPIDVGYLTGYTLASLIESSITGVENDKFVAGRLGEYTVTADPSGGTEVLLGAPFKFDADNIGDWKTVY